MAAGHARQLAKNHGDEKEALGTALVRVLESSASFRSSDLALDRKLIGLLLDAGADANHVHRATGSGKATSPLSAALLSSRHDLFSFLVERGANVNGPSRPKYSDAVCYPLHVPVCAAAFIMAKAGEDSSSMYMCLQYGANINTRVLVSHDERISFTTPLGIYLEEIEQWGVADHPNLLKKLEFLLINGALSPDVIKNDIKGPERGELRQPSSNGLKLESAKSCFDRLMEKWDADLHSSHEPELLSSLKLLVRYGTSIDSFIGAFREYHDLLRPPGKSTSYSNKRILRHRLESASYLAFEEMEGMANQPSSSEDDDDLNDRENPAPRWALEACIPPRISLRPPNKLHHLAFWREILDTIVNSPQYRKNLNYFLFVYIFTKTPLIHYDDRDGYPKNANATKLALFRETVTALIQAGADTNCRIGLSFFNTLRCSDFIVKPSKTDGITVLQAICYFHLDTAQSQSDVDRLQTPYFPPSHMCFKFRYHTKTLFEVLVHEFRANPYLAYRGHTSVDILQEIFYLKPQWCNLYMRNHAAIILEAIEMPGSAAAQHWANKQDALRADMDKYNQVMVMEDKILKREHLSTLWEDRAVSKKKLKSGRWKRISSTKMSHRELIARCTRRTPPRGS